MSAEALLTLDEVAEMLRKSVGQLRWMIHQGTAPKSGVIGGRRMFRARDVEAFLTAAFDDRGEPGSPIGSGQQAAWVSLIRGVGEGFAAVAADLSRVGVEAPSTRTHADALLEAADAIEKTGLHVGGSDEAVAR